MDITHTHTHTHDMNMTCSLTVRDQMQAVMMVHPHHHYIHSLFNITVSYAMLKAASTGVQKTWWEGGRDVCTCTHVCILVQLIHVYNVIHTASFSPFSTAFSFTVFLVLVMVCNTHSMYMYCNSEHGSHMTITLSKL